MTRVFPVQKDARTISNKNPQFGLPSLKKINFCRPPLYQLILVGFEVHYWIF
jgi:hypothetical protein